MPPQISVRLPRLPYRYIGILGGSFDPPHTAHLMISCSAQRTLALDKILWLLTPQNPLKNHRSAPLDARLKSARIIAKPYPQIIATDLEAKLKTRYTIDTIRALKACYPKTRFVWLMGSDNLMQLHRWKAWQKFVREVPLAIYLRPPDATRALLAPASRYLAHTHRHTPVAARHFKNQTPPAWLILKGAQSTLSSSQIRKKSKQIID